MKNLFLCLILTMLSSLSFGLGTPKDLVDLDRLPVLEDYESFMVSSYDRTGGNDDGFSGTYSFIRKEGDDLVIFDEKGPGIIRRIWTPNLDTSDINNKNKVSVFIDGKLILKLDNFLDFFNGKVYPFQKPFANMQMGAAYSYVPIPFEKSCKIVVHGEKFHFYQITWDKHKTNTGIKSFANNFSKEYKTQLTKAAKYWENTGKYPSEIPEDTQTLKFNKRVRGNKPGILASISKAEGKILSFKLKIKSDDPRAFRKVALIVWADDIKLPVIASPVGDFFLNGFNQSYSKSLLLGAEKDEYYCYLPMPFKNNIRIVLGNGSGSEVKATGEIIWSKSEFTKDTGYLYAFWHREERTPFGTPFQILNATGRGKYIGVSHAMQGNDGNLGYLEGDEIAAIDGRDGSFYHGTGTEDYFNGGWYFINTDNAPLHGCGVLDNYGRCLAFRLHLTDSIPFQKSADITIEHGHNNEYEADYSGVTYFYGDKDIKYDGFNYANVIPKSLRIANAMEAEENILSDCIIMDDLKENFTYSNGKAVSSGNTPAIMNLNVNVSGRYNLKAFIFGKSEIFLDEISMGIFDGGKGELIKIAENKYLKEGSHMIEIKSFGDDKAVIDYFLLEDAGKTIEAENLKITNPKQDKVNVGVQDLGSFMGKWSGDAHIFFMAKEVGDFYEADIPTKGLKGKYMLSAYFTKAPDYGIIKIYADGKLCTEFDGFAGGVSRSERISLGEVDITSDVLKIKIEVTGKNQNSSGYYSGVDCFYLE